MTLALDVTEMLRTENPKTVKKLDWVGEFLLDPLAAGMQILANKPEFIPTLPGFRIPDFQDFIPLAELVGADPSKHLEMVRALETFRGQISDAIASASIQCVATGLKLTAIAFDLVEKGSKAIAMGSTFGPIGIGLTVVGLIKEAYEKAKAELDKLEAELAKLGQQLKEATDAALAVVVPGGTEIARQALNELCRQAGLPPVFPEPAPAPAPPSVKPVAPPPAAPPAAYTQPASAPPQLPGGAGAPSPAAAAAVEAAKSQLGTPYVWGGSAPGGFDCSGLTSWAYRQAGVEIPRVAIDQRVGQQVGYDELLPGDLVVWSGHVAMYTGGGMMIEAGNPVQMNPVRTDNIGMEFLGFWRPTA